MHPLVPKIRFWLWLTGVAAIACLWPAYGMFAFATGFGWWTGCGCCGGTCANCSTSPTTTYQIDISGVTNGTCTDCAHVNRSYIVTSTASCTACAVGAPCCQWSLSASTTLCGTTGSNTLYLCIIQDSSNVFGAGTDHIWITSQEDDGIIHPVVAGQWAKDYGNVTKPSCASFSSESIPYYTNSSLGKCNASGASFLVTAL